MRIQLASDLHLELLERFWPLERLVAPAPGADVLQVKNVRQGLFVFQHEQEYVEVDKVETLNLARIAYS